MLPAYFFMAMFAFFCVPFLFLNRTGYTSLFCFILLFIGFFILEFSREPLIAPDSNNYKIMYDGIDSIDSVFTQYHGDYFFSFIQYLGRVVGIDYSIWVGLFSIGSVLIYVYGSYLILGGIKYAAISFALLLSTASFVFMFHNTLRQGLAISLFVLGMGFFFRGDKVKGGVSLCFSFFSHFSVVILLLIGMFSATKLSKLFLKKWVVIILPLILIVASPFFVSVMMNLVPKLSSLNRGHESTILFFIKLFISYFSVVIFRFVLYERLRLHVNVIKLFDVIFFLLCFTCLVSTTVLFASRYLYYISTIMPIFMSLIFLFVYRVSHGFRYITYFSCIVLYVLYFLFVYTYPSSGYLMV